MEAALSSRHRVRFNDFELDLDTRELYRNGIRLKVQGQPIGVLEILLQHPGDLVTREGLRKALWAADTFVDFDHSLNAAVMKLREALGDTADKPLYIETIPRRGYRFIASVTTKQQCPADTDGFNSNQSLSEISSVQQSANEITLETRSWWNRHFERWFIVGVLFACAGVTIWFLNRQLPPPLIPDFVQLTHEGQIKWPIGTDGVRVYFNQWLKEGNAYGEVSVSGGDVSWVPIDLADPYLHDVSPDGTMLLVSSDLHGKVGLWSYHLIGRTLRHLTDSTVASASWSPDGTRIAYANAYGEIILIRSDGTNPRTVVPAAGSLANLNTRPVVWSPDGHRIRFHRGKKIWEVSPEGAGLHLLVPDWRKLWSQEWGRWTPDGNLFIFVSCAPSPAASDCQLWGIDEHPRRPGRSHSDPIQLTFGPMNWDHPVFSKDGQRIFARGNIQRGELVRHDARSGRFQPFLGGISADWLTFSPDGTSVAYTSFPEGILWRANLDGSNPVRLSDPPHYPFELRWSPDGSKILFIELDSQNHAVAYTVSPAGGEPQRVMPGSTQSIMDPNWSADSKKIVFTQMAFGGPNAARNESSDIRILDLQSQQVQTLAGSNSLSSPRWSPDGRFICALGRDSLQLFDTRTRKWSKLSGGLHYGFPSFSRDSRSIYFLALGEPGGVYRIPISGGKEERVIDLTGFRHTGIATFWMGLDPSDAPILLREMGTDEIYALTLERK